MTFVETDKTGFFCDSLTGKAAAMEESPVVPTESATPAPASKTKTFVTSMVLAMIIFPFMLGGMTTASTWVMEKYVIPRINVASHGYSTPLPAVSAEQTGTADATASTR